MIDKESKGTINSTNNSTNNSTKTKEQKEIEALMDSIIYENKEALSELAK
ncbi:MAG TPA: hypothetical protein GXX36_06710 [Clostridiaceae bacterium]|nr:hypothetical protein [Clostridiaceae bacterium]